MDRETRTSAAQASLFIFLQEGPSYANTFGAPSPQKIEIVGDEKINSETMLETNTVKIMNVLSRKSRYEFLLGDCREILRKFPDKCIDCVITSPPYWKQREYEIGKEYKGFIIGNEIEPSDYIKKLTAVFHEVKRVLKPTGSLWLNIGDKYYNKRLMGMPWRVALALQDDNWILRNDIIWNQLKGTQSPKDRLRDVYEHIFHFVKNDRYFYNDERIRIKPKKHPYINNGEIISATGVSGKKYREQIINSKHLTEEEKEQALKALDETIGKMKRGETVDFRMTIRGQQRTYHSDNGNISGRAKELERKGYFILESHAEGYMPSDIWNIVPEDVWRKDTHYAVFPTELLEIPIKATLPPNGILLDPFMGIGSAIAAAVMFGGHGIGIDISEKYINIAQKRMREIKQQSRH
jgi:site-specific DNA-methyltransferase (adenine-specific)